jgi:hypothetical protein
MQLPEQYLQYGRPGAVQDNLPEHRKERELHMQDGDKRSMHRLLQEPAVLHQLHRFLHGTVLIPIARKDVEITVRHGSGAYANTLLEEPFRIV